MNSGQLSLIEAARVLGKSPRQVMRYRKEKKLQARGGGRALRFDQAEVEALRRRMEEALRYQVEARRLRDGNPKRYGVNRCEFRRRRPASAIVNEDLLARIAFAFILKRGVRRGLEDPSMDTAVERANIEQMLLKCLNVRFLVLWKLHKSNRQDAVDELVGNGLPGPEDVPPDVQNWAQSIGQMLTPAEMEYVAALFIVTEHPVDLHNLRPAALRQLLRLIKAARPQMFVTAQTFGQTPQEWSWIEDSVRNDLDVRQMAKEAAGHVEASGVQIATGGRQRLQALFGQVFFEDARLEHLDQTKKEAAYLRYRKNHPGIALVSTLIPSFLDAQGDRLRELTAEGVLWEEDKRPVKFLEAGELLESLVEEAKEFKRYRDSQGKGKPSGAKIAAVLGIHRFQATRLWRGEKGRKGIAEKIGENGMLNLAQMLGFDSMPRAWQSTYTYRGEECHRFPWVKKRPTKAMHLGRQLSAPEKDPWAAGTMLKEESDRMERAGTGKGRPLVSREDTNEMYGS